MRIPKISIVKFLLIGIAMLMLCATTNFAQQVSITLPSVTRQAGSPDDTLAISTGDITGKNVTAFQFTLSYDKNVVYITNALKAGLSTLNGSLMNVNADTANHKITVAWASANAMTGSGTLLNIVVHYRNVGTTSLSFNNTFVYNGGVPPVNAPDGSITIPTLAVGFGTMSAHVGDTVLIPITTGALTLANAVMSFDFTATYTASVLKILGLESTGTLSAGGSSAVNTNTSGVIRVAWGSGNVITGANGSILIYVKAVVIGAGTSTQAFTSFEYNAGTPTAGGISGTLTATIIPPPVTYSISGSVTYDNTGNTPVPGAVVVLTPGTGSTAMDTTDASGMYSFASLSAGSFNVSVSKTTGWGGINAADALKAAQFFLNPTTFPLDTVQILAADVDNSGSVNSNDALSIIRRYVGLSSSFTKPDWTFFPASSSETITNANITLNIKALATGDVNASLSPIAKRSSLNLVSASSMNVKPGSSFEVPISVGNDMQVGSISLKLTYPQALAKYEGITVAAGSNIITNVKDGVISLAWADFSGGNNPMPLKANSVLATLRFTANNNIAGDKFALDIQNGSEFTGANGEALNNSSLLMPSVNLSVPSEFSLKQNYPNPFNPSTTIEFSIPEAGNVALTIYNITGQEVAKLVNGVQNAGSHNVVWNASNLSSGIYFYRLNFDGPSKKFSDIKSMVLLK